MAETQKISGDYFGSEENATEALLYLKNSHNQIYLSEAYNLLGICYRKLLNFDKAIEYYNQAAKIAKDSISKSIVQNNIAMVYFDKKDYTSALKILTALNASAIVQTNLSAKARVLNNIGSIYQTINNPAALSYLQNSLNIRLKTNDLPGMLSGNIQLAKYYAAKNKKVAASYALKAYNIATKIKNPDERLTALQILINVLPEKESKKEAIGYFTINDSLTKMRLKNKSEFASIKYNSKNTEAENLRLKNQQTQNKLQAQNDRVLKLVFVMIACGAVATAFFIVIVQRLKHKKAKIIEVYNTESRISKKIHDELANDMFDTMMFTESLHFDTDDKKETLLKRLDSVYEKTRDISRENSSVDTGNDFYIVLIEMLARYKTPQLNVLPVNTHSVSWNVLDEHKKVTIYRVLQEFMVNMKKHSQATLVVVKFTVADKKLHISYADNGVGIKKNNFFYKNGLQNAENRIKSINGTITFDDITKGLKISIAIPL
ncbi:hypothetical protein Q766_03230 [Flavobacterium subsaxonicum WB 4.1-42 = DSM 21790]|uniref:Uncharacterized protein n=2 Tax=Flavobacterium TaxID=237 RepID=A0A0A2MS13_9FLAO|nr:hypothetical protein Q766_03230 [Flavobacterium subsaxonicum WB 4.1-42 = DSM 21790]